MNSNTFQYFLPLILSILRYFILSGIPFLVFYVIYKESYAKSKIQSQNATNKDYVREIIYSMQTSFILVGMVLFVLKSPLRQYTQLYQSLSEYPLWWIPVSVVLSFIIHDTYFYWAHRMMHHPKLFQRVHSLHHKSTNPSPWASYSFHFIESILQGLIIPIILLVLPMHIISIALFAFLNFATNVYGHLGYEIVPKWFRHSFLFHVLNTSIFHNMHHTKFNHNFGLYFRFWDRVMKTENPNYIADFDKIQARRFGS